MSYKLNFAMEEPGEPYELSEEQRNELRQEMAELLGEYEYETTEKGLDRIIDEWKDNKGAIIRMMEKHPNYNGKFQIVLDADFSREVDVDEAYSFKRWVYDSCAANCADDNKDTSGKFLDFVHVTDVITGVGQFISKEEADLVNEHLPIKVAEGQKRSRVVNKICKYMGIDKWREYNQRFARYSDSVNPLKIKRHTILSCHPVDYYTMSFGNSWASCHTIDKKGRRCGEQDYEGCYSAGTESYMMDESSVVFYTVDSRYQGNSYELCDKVNRNMFHIGKDKIIQGRVYPQSNDGDNGIYTDFRNIVQKIVADCLNVPNLWELKRGMDVCMEMSESTGSHYKDYLNFDCCNVSFLKGNEGEIDDENAIFIGHATICPNCGQIHYDKECISCCGYIEDHVCEDCGYEISEEDAIIINGEYYCQDCVTYCEYHEGYEPSYNTDFTRVYGYGIVCDDALEEDGSFLFDYYEQEYFYEKAYNWRR